MNFSVPPFRRIASNRLWTPGGLVRNPLVTLDAAGRIRSVEVCPDPDRLPATEFYAGMIVPDFPPDYRAAFERLRREPDALSDALSRLLPAPDGVTVVLTGLDYSALRLLPQAQIRKL